MLVAAGLILSWGQVGNRMQQKSVELDQREYLLLRTEADCDLEQAPCAAFAPDFAIVVKLTRQRGWHTLQVRTAGESLNEQSQVRMSFEPRSSLYETEELPIRFQAPETWYSDVQLPDMSQTVWQFRVQVERQAKVMVADYPLPGAKAVDDQSSLQSLLPPG